ncbi:hypothetical protein KV697_19600 (plasmid) [Sphingomonas sanguinis]|uniref:hypothetical protein n=1 Tax=Sphingomonas sanguinis TaxID=33051 RepID=UPI001C58FCC6|nr:hypothetical protein [Sphingomonas sanguinis]QXT38026.1 hypothetical protein KV697_19600 [Sphingomonas sanguinis]
MSQAPFCHATFFRDGDGTISVHTIGCPTSAIVTDIDIWLMEGAFIILRDSTTIAEMIVRDGQRPFWYRWILSRSHGLMELRHRKGTVIEKLPGGLAPRDPIAEK